MKQTIKITGLDCPNCAKALESAINKLSQVDSASIDFTRCTLTYESKEADAIDAIKKVTKEIEPDVVLETPQAKPKKDKSIWLDTITLGLGIALAIVLYFVAMPKWLFWTTFSVSAMLLGYKTYYKALRLLLKRMINENLLITLSVLGATLLGEWIEGLMVIALYSIGKIFEGLAVSKSRKSIEKLTQFKPEYAVLVDKDGQTKQVEPNEVKVGQHILVKAGEKVPIDGVVISGQATLNMQSLTGESVPVTISEGQQILSGSIVLDGVLTIKTSTLYENSTVSKIMTLIESASEKKSKTETVISKIARWYTLAVMGIALLVWGIVWAVTKSFDDAVYRGLIFLVTSCPCAFAISVPLTYFLGLGNASRRGILIKGSNYLDACAKLQVVAFDKTGTLTTGQFEVEKVESFDKSLSQEDILYFASLGEQNSNHPLAHAIVRTNKKELTKVTDVKEVAGEGVYYTYQKVSYFVGRRSKNLKDTCVEVWQQDKLLGCITLQDSIKASSKQTIEKLHAMGLTTAMLSGDNEASVTKVVEATNIDEGYHNLLPQDKYDYIEKCKATKKVGYVGDGMNDAPTLALSDVGFSMGLSGSGASIEVSDVVLVDDNPMGVATAIKLSRHTRRIVWQNIILSAGVKFIFLLLGSLGVTGMLSAVFADVGVTLLAILNSMRALYYKANK